MLRNLALLCFIIAGVMAFRGGSSIVWPIHKRRIDRAEAVYGEWLKELFRPMGTARTIANAQYLGVLGLALLIYLASGNVIFAITIPATCFFLPKLWFDRLRKQRRDKINHQLPDALRVMADAAKSGLALPRMIRMVAEQGSKPVSEEFGLIVHAIDLGDSVDDALKRTATRLKIPNFDLMTIAILVNRERGGDVADLFVRLAESIRSLTEAEEKIETQTASIRLSAKIMICTIPLFAVILFLFDPESMSMLFRTALGAIVLMLVALLATTGYRMILRLANPEI